MYKISNTRQQYHDPTFLPPVYATRTGCLTFISMQDHLQISICLLN
uniref:Uncharacterized protein n=1 Tax=Triticum urartu TaxID=4572 RepID=A0A8R7Q2I4_TRIUA